MKSESEGLYVISVAARLADVHPQTLRMYERKGLLKPARTAKNRRSYSDEDIERIRHITELTQERGLNLSGVRMVLQMEDDLADLRRNVESMRKQMTEMKRRLRDEVYDMKRQVALMARPTSSLVPRTRRRTRS